MRKICERRNVKGPLVCRALDSLFPQNLAGPAAGINLVAQARLVWEMLPLQVAASFRFMDACIYFCSTLLLLMLLFQRPSFQSNG